MRAVGVSLPVGSVLRRAAAPLLHADGSQLLELPGTVGGLPGADPVTYLPVLPEIVVELQVDQLQPEFGRYRHRPRVIRIRADLYPMQLSPLATKGDSQRVNLTMPKAKAADLLPATKIADLWVKGCSSWSRALPDGLDGVRGVFVQPVSPKLTWRGA
ncbi:hypothetical protein YWIDRAFT_08044 [Streptomyces sp. SceaMP-e96]|nr:hypothetical protein YWIDRAFT_08044 [Streptomyces sp. SceaMP-e96]